MMFERVCDAVCRFVWLGSLMRSPFHVALYILRGKFDKGVIGKARYKAQDFSFRIPDLSALKEVLIDAEYDFLADVLKDAEKPRILDIGAHIGTFGLWALGVNAQADILSVEADPATFEILRSNAARENWQVINRAAWKDDAALSFSVDGDSMGHHVSGDGAVSVQGMVLPDMMDVFGGGDIDLMKLDIEGAEEAFLCAHPQGLARVRRLVIELHPDLCDIDRVRAVLAEYFADIKDVGGRVTAKPLLYCRR